MEFKVGQRVRVIRGVCSAGNEGEVLTINSIDSSSREIRFKEHYGFCWTHSQGHLEILETKTMENLQPGDVLVNKDYSYKRIVQGVLGVIVFTIDNDDSTVRYDTVSDLRAEDWTVEGAEPEVTEISMDEIAQKLDIPVEKLRIKKDD